MEIKCVLYEVKKLRPPESNILRWLCQSSGNEVPVFRPEKLSSNTTH
jgi:hypothetical protein